MKTTKIVISILIFMLLVGCQGQPTAPSARYGAKMIFDPVNERIILYGGRTDSLIGLKYFDDLWTFDIQNQTWTPLRSEPRPAGRLSPGMVYDPIGHQIILFGGHTKQDRINETWTYDLAADRWEEVLPQNSPPPRSDMGMVYDEANEVVILFGGYCRDDLRELCDDTWAFDPQTDTWTEMNPQNHPPITYGHSLTYDPLNMQSLLSGGHMSEIKDGVFSSIGYGETLWRYSYPNNAWDEIPSTSNHPNPRYWHMADFEQPSGQLFIFGGDGGNGFLADTWIFNSTAETWMKINVKDAPSPRLNASLIYDPVNDVFLLFGGYLVDRSSMQDTWIFMQMETGQNWVKIQ